MSRKFRQWVTEYQDEAWSLARHLLRDDAEAEDAVQESFTSLWNHRASIDPPRVRFWLMRVLRNECFDRLRRRRPSSPLEDGDAIASGGPAREAELSQLSMALRTALAGLGEPHRSLVVMRDMQQHSYEDVGRALDLSPSQVKVYLHRARKLLREQLEEMR